MKLKYDFHIHTALSPCALEEMSPNNIVNMAIMNELDVIAVTDHNSCKNLKSLISVAEGTDLIIIPGMEIESREEIHVVCLFSDIDSVYNMQTFVYDNLPMLKNKPKVLGKQLIFDTEDEIIGEEERLLSFATQLSFEEIIDKTWELGGIAIPAHIDRPSYSVISNLGMIPINQRLTCLEISQYADYQKYQQLYNNYRVLQTSDSHELGFIGITNQYIDVPTKMNQILTGQDIIDYLRSPLL